MSHNDPAEPPWTKTNDYDWGEWAYLTLQILS